MRLTYRATARVRRSQRCADRSGPGASAHAPRVRRRPSWRVRSGRATKPQGAFRSGRSHSAKPRRVRPHLGSVASSSSPKRSRQPPPGGATCPPCSRSAFRGILAPLWGSLARVLGIIPGGRGSHPRSRSLTSARASVAATPLLRQRSPCNRRRVVHARHAAPSLTVSADRVACESADQICVA